MPPPNTVASAIGAAVAKYSEYLDLVGALLGLLSAYYLAKPLKDDIEWSSRYNELKNHFSEKLASNNGILDKNELEAFKATQDSLIDGKIRAMADFRGAAQFGLLLLRLSFLATLFAVAARIFVPQR